MSLGKVFAAKIFFRIKKSTATINPAKANGVEISDASSNMKFFTDGKLDKYSLDSEIDLGNS